MEAKIARSDRDAMLSKSGQTKSMGSHAEWAYKLQRDNACIGDRFTVSIERFERFANCAFANRLNKRTGMTVRNCELHHPKMPPQW